jgi:small-conductance mechanosensitive channel
MPDDGWLSPPAGAAYTSPASEAHAMRRGIILLLGVFLFGSLATVAAAQPVAGAVDAVSPAESAVEPATLVVNNRPIVTLRGMFLGRTPEQRVAAARLRITAVLDAETEGAITAHPTSEGSVIALGGQMLLLITPQDVDELAGETVESEARAAVAALELALAERLELRDTRRMAWAIGRTLVTLLLFLALLTGVRRVYGVIDRILDRRAELWAGKTSIRGFAVLTPSQLLTVLRRSAQIALAALVLFGAYLWLAFVLRQFPFTRPWGEQLGGFLFGSLKTVLAAMLGWIPGLFVAVLIILLTRWLTRLVSGFFTAVEEGRVAMPEAVVETAQPTRRITNAVLWMLALVMVYPYLPGSDSPVFKGISVFVGLVVSLGASGVVGQYLSGLVIMYSRALRPGDVVRIGDDEGVVVSLGMLSTKLRTIKREEINIPNNLLVSTATRNYSRLAGEHGAILYTTVTIGYDAPWRQVHAMLIEAADRTPGLRREPRPFVLQTALSDFYVEYQLNAHVERPEQRLTTRAALHSNIQDVFNEHGVQIMSPHYESDPGEKKWVPRERWHEPPAKPPGGTGGG